MLKSNSRQVVTFLLGKKKEGGIFMFPNWREVKVTTYILLIITLLVLVSTVIEYREFL